ncbi:MAG: EAL domain-containing protein [Cyanobium sp.]|nr:EAL domain-containing protein [Cyanobium sp.]
MTERDATGNGPGRILQQSDFSRLLENLPGFAYQCRNDEHWSTEYISERFKDFTGLPTASMLENGKLDYISLIHPDDRDRVVEGVQTAIREHRHYDLEYRINLEDRGERWFADRGCGLYDSEDQLLTLTGFATDITERKLAESKLQRSEHRFRQLFEASLDAVSVIDLSGRMLETNRAAPLLFGCTDRDSFLNYHPADLSPEFQPDGRRSRDAAAAAIAEACRLGTHEFSWLHKRLDTGETFEAVVSLHRIELEGKAALLARVSDVSERLRYEQRLRQLAFEDPLTGLPNRLAALEWLNNHLADKHEERLLILTIDIDNFQWLNNTFGREQCDLLLISLARAMRETAGSSGLAARLQSDEFLMITRLPANADGAGQTEEPARTQQEHQVTRVLTDLQTILTTTMRLPTVLSFCVGSTMHPNHASAADPVDNAESLLQQVNTALGEARRTGPNHQAIYEPGMNGMIEKRLVLETRLVRAVAGQEFHIHYQPIVGREGLVVAAEALLRWPQRDGGFVSPAAFIPLAEKTGRIRELGRWLIDATCAQLGDWRDKGLELGHLSINISATQLCNSEDPLLLQLMRAIEKHRLPAGILQLEITESAVLDNMDLARAELEGLAAAGFRLALDDFGTGFSSLLTLQQLPFDALKIDKSFVQKAEKDGKSRALVESCVSIAQKLGMDCVAEGVETELQCLQLRRMGCGYYQGYLFDRPLPAADLERRLLIRHSQNSAGRRQRVHP